MIKIEKTAEPHSHPWQWLAATQTRWRAGIARTEQEANDAAQRALVDFGR